MRLHLLGVHGPYPASGEATSGYLLEAGNQMLQLDFGSGVLSRLTAVFPPEDLSAILISHWHYDHTCDLLPLIYRLESLGKCLPVYAPEDDSSPLRKVVEKAACFELHTVSDGQSFPLGNIQVLVGPARHPVPGVGFVIRENEKLLGYTGDTNTHPGLKDFYQNCGLLLSCGPFPQAVWAETRPQLSARMAAELARDAGAGKLIVTHLNPAFPASLLLKEAREVFPEVCLARSGEVFSL